MSARDCSDYNLQSSIQLLMFNENKGFPGGSVVKNPSAKQETWILSLGWEDLLEKEMAIHSSILD